MGICYQGVTAKKNKTKQIKNKNKKQKNQG